MRISNYTITRNYRSNLNTAQAKLYQANMKAATGDRITSMDEDVARGLRAFKVRRELQKTDTYLDNVKDVQSFYAAVEDNVSNIVEVGKSLSELYVAACTGTNGEDEHKTFATQLERLQEQLLTTLNSKFSDRYLLGGTKTNSAPFGVKDGDLTYTYKISDTASAFGNVGDYHTVKVKDLIPGTPVYDDVFSDPSFVDIGLGMTLNVGEIIPSTAYDRSLNGLSVIGTGPDNMYDLITKAIKSLNDGNPDNEFVNKFNKSYKDAAVTLTKLGADTDYLDFAVERLTSERINLITRQDGLEKVPLDEAAMEFKMQEYLYNAALQMGTRLLQPSLFSFLN